MGTELIDGSVTPLGGTVTPLGETVTPLGETAFTKYMESSGPKVNSFLLLIPSKYKT